MAGDRFPVNARVVATETGETLVADNTATPAAGLIALSGDSVVLRSKSGAAFRSTIIPGWGQFYNCEEIKRGAFLLVELGILGTVIGYPLAGMGKESDYNNKKTREALCGSDVACDPTQAAESLRLGAESNCGTRNLLLVGAGFWVLNLIDAYLSGHGDGPGAGDNVR